MKKTQKDILAQGLTITEFIRHPQLLNDQSNSLAQGTILKSIYGLELSDAELEIYYRGTGREVYDAREQREITVLAGRRSGKTGKIGAPVGLYEAFRDHRIPRGERACVVLIAPTIAQAEIARDYMYNGILSSPILSARVAKCRKNEIMLKSRITILCCACSSISLRGMAVVAAILDEVSFMRNEQTSVHCDEDVLAALRPAMITFPESKLIKITTPHAKRGVVWNEYRRRPELNYPVWQLSTTEMNPTVSAELLEQERERSLENFKREFLAEFTDNVVSWIEPEVLDACSVQGRKELPRVNDGTYVAAVDPAFKQSDFGLAIAHRTSGGLIVLDYVARWTGTKKAPLGFERVCREIADILRGYGINEVQGDQYAAAAIQQEFLKLGIRYREKTFNRQTRPQLFNNLKHLLLQRKIELLDQPELLQQLRALEEYKMADGGIDIRPGHGKDDLAIVLALCAFELSQSGCALPLGPIIFDRASRPWDDDLARVDASRGGYLVSGYCSKFPKCWEAGHCECYGF
jgi:hypothetical protein